MSAKDDLDDEPLGLDKPDSPAEGKGDANLDGGDETVDAAPADDLDVVVVDGDEPAPAAKDAGAEQDDAPADDEPAADEDGDALSEDDKKSLSKNVQARIMRERAVRKRMVEAAEERVREESGARQVAEKRMLDLELTTARMADKTLKTDIKEAKAEMILAQEAGETAKAADAMEKLNALQIRAREVESLTADLETKVEKAKTAPAASAKPAMRPITVAWIERNKAWFSNDKFAVATAAAKTISAQLDREGISPDDPKHYLELDRRLHREMPGLRQRLKAEGRPANRPGPGTIVAPSRPAPARGTNSNRITLTKDDLTNMRAFGMDPTNKAHLQEYARSKQGVAANG